MCLALGRNPYFFNSDEWGEAIHEGCVWRENGSRGGENIEEGPHHPIKYLSDVWWKLSSSLGFNEPNEF